MNYKKLIIGISIVNILGWALIELWSKRYAESNIETGTGFLIGLQLLCYYIIVVASRVPSVPKKPEEIEIKPHNCPGHDWQRHKYSSKEEQCVKCGAERGISTSA